MKTLSALFLLLAVQVSAQVQFTKSENWKKVLAEAKEGNKLIFVDVFTDWCGPCKEMDKNVFPDKKLGDFYNSNFINFKANATKGKQQEYFNDKYDIIGYPSFLVFDSNGKLLHRRVGGGEVSHMIDFAKDALNPEMRYTFLLENFEKNKNDLEFRKNHLIAKANVGAVSTEDVDSFFQLVPKENWSDSVYWKAFSYSNYNMDSEIAKYFVSNSDKFMLQNHAAEVHNKALNLIEYQFLNLRNAEEIDTGKYEELLELIKNTPYSYKILEFELTNAQFEERLKDYLNLAQQMLHNPIYFKNSNLMNEIAWDIVSNHRYDSSEVDYDALTIARQMAEFSLMNERRDYNLDTYANILYFLGDKIKAIELEKEAISLAENDSKKELEKTLEKMERGTLE